MTEWAMEHEESFNRYNEHQYNSNFLMVFTSQKLSDATHKYAIVAADVFVISKDVVIESLEILFNTNEEDIDFSSNPSDLSRQILANHTVNNYPYLDRFYLGDIETVSDLKEHTMNIVKDDWMDVIPLEIF